MTPAVTSCPSRDTAARDGYFLSLLPRITTHAQIYFRHIKCPHRRADRIAETVAVAWKWYCRLFQRGKDITRFPMAFSSLAARAVRHGRRACSQERAKDVLSPRAQQLHGFLVEPLPHSTAVRRDKLYGDPLGQGKQDAFEERFRDNTQTPVVDQVCVRLDWPRFLQTLSQRDRHLADYLSLGHNAKQAARKFRISPGRVTQLRQQWHREWHAFQGEEGPKTTE